MNLSVLDQSPIVAPGTAAEAIQQTMELVKLTDALGYQRYWFAEHHGSASFASASPPVMIAAAAAVTERIRLGSGGMLMGHGSPLQIAETFRALEALAPGRIDLGMGRAPGGDQRVMSALGFDPKSGVRNIQSVMAMLRDDRMASNSGEVVAVPDQALVPDGVAAPEVWMLGTSPDSARVAGEMGLAYAFGAFIDPTNMDAALASYHQSFVSSEWCKTPKTLVATVVFCAETTERAQAIASCSERWFVHSFLRGQNVRFPAEGALSDITDQERIISAFRRESVVIGNPEQCRRKLEELQKRTQCDEISVVTITEKFEDRLRSYELLAG